MQDEHEDYQRKAAELRVEHRDLNDVIDRLSINPDIDEFQLKRLKKRKLHLKDQLSLLESKLIPNIKA